MRFKSTIDHVSLLTALLQSAEKMGKRAILKLTDDTMFLICAKGEGDVQMWSNVPVDNIFSDYRIESNSNKNTIALEFNITSLVQALRSASSRGDHRDAVVAIKLVKRGEDAALGLDIKTQTKDGKKVNIVHEVHVLVRKPAEIEEMSQPKCPPLETHIELPSAEQCRPIVDHLRQISDIIWLGATRDGRFKFSVSNDSTDIQTTWTGLRNTAIGEFTAKSDREKTDSMTGKVRENAAEEGEGEVDDSAWHMVPLDSKVLQKWFSSQILQNSVIAGIAAGYCVVAYIYVGDRQHGGIITYYIPSRNVDFD